MKKNKYDKEVYRSLTLITQFGINMLVPIFICTFIGIFLDNKFGTSFIVIIMFFLGAAAGARNVYVFARNMYDKPSNPYSSSRSSYKKTDDVDKKNN